MQAHLGRHFEQEIREQPALWMRLAASGAASRLARELDGDVVLVGSGSSLFVAQLGALALRRPGPHQLQAAIAALHVDSARTDETDWEQIAQLYAMLARFEPSPVIELNRAVAVAFASDPQAGLELLRPLLGQPAMESYQPLHAAHAELLRRTGDHAGALRAYTRAIELSTNAVERAELERRIHALSR